MLITWFTADDCKHELRISPFLFWPFQVVILMWTMWGERTSSTSFYQWEMKLRAGGSTSSQPGLPPTETLCPWDPGINDVKAPQLIPMQSYCAFSVENHAFNHVTSLKSRVAPTSEPGVFPVAGRCDSNFFPGVFIHSILQQVFN